MSGKGVLALCFAGMLPLAVAGCDMDSMAPTEPVQIESDEAQAVQGDFDIQAVSYTHGVLLIDRSGSMTVRRVATGNTRCADALTQAREKVDRFFERLNGTGLSIWLFQGSGATALSSGYVNRATAINLINGLSPSGCNGNTPLADAMCAAADGVVGSLTLNPSPGYMHVATDGGENNSTGQCRGPSGAVGTPGTWQNKVLNKILSRGIVPVDIAYWITPTVLNSMGDRTAPTVDPETGKPRPEIYRNEATPAASCGTVEECESALFATLAASTRGEYGVVRDNDTDYPCAYGTCPPPKPPGHEPWSQQD